MKLVLLVLMSLALLASPARAAAPVTAPSVCKSSAQPIDEKGFVRIGGIEQWITIKGSRCANPVLLFLHGGPGNPNSPFAASMYASWEKDFTIVQWDQRGAGMTFGRNKPAEEDRLTIEQMRDDGLAVATYLQQHLAKRKVILMGSSWSSILGVYMIKARPELFYAYVGSSHIVGSRENQATTYTRLLAMAREAGDKDSIAKLEAVGAPPWINPRNSGIVRRVVYKYEAMHSDPSPKTWAIAPEYATPKAQADYEGGEDYSYIQFVGMKGDGMYAGVDLPKLGTTFAIPFYMVQGESDLLTLPDVSRRYFDSIQAPRKEFVSIPQAGHDPNQAMLDAQFRILKERVVPRLD
jgi:pimeloyl-ACP methyl ester carboxylesterase